MIDVLVEIKSDINYDTQVETVEVKTSGTMSKQANEICIIYNEDEAGETPLSTTVCINLPGNDKGLVVTVCRHGTPQLVIESGVRHVCDYDTQYGKVLLAVCGEEIQCNFDGNNGVLQMKYVLDMNGSQLSENIMTLNVRESV